MYRTQSKWMKQLYFFHPEKVFFTPVSGVFIIKKLVSFIIIFLWEKITKNFQCDNIL